MNVTEAVEIITNGMNHLITNGWLDVNDSMRMVIPKEYLISDKRTIDKNTRVDTYVRDSRNNNSFEFDEFDYVNNISDLQQLIVLKAKERRFL